MNIVQIAGVAIVGCCLVLTVRQQRPELAMLLSAAIGILLLLSCISDIQQLLQKIQEIANSSGLKQEVVSIIFKVIGIVYVTEFASGICKDAKEEAMALKVQLAGKIIILGFSVPLVLDILQKIEDMLL